MRDPAKPLQQAGARVFNHVFKEMTRCKEKYKKRRKMLYKNTKSAQDVHKHTKRHTRLSSLEEAQMA
jgi:aspartate/methionine/tyrosine aminotransferase